MTRKQRRLTLIGAAGLVLAVAAGLILYALTDRIVFFNPPTDVLANDFSPGSRIRLGGLVADGSLVRGDGGRVTFAVTDGNATVPVAFVGILPDLFREGQGVVTEGVLTPEGSLAARLAEEGSDAEGWARLVRAYMVLDRPDDARDALVRARIALVGDPAGLAAVETAARDAGVLEGQGR